MLGAFTRVILARSLRLPGYTSTELRFRKVIVDLISSSALLLGDLSEEMSWRSRLFAIHSPKRIMVRRDETAALLQGTLDLLILKTLTRVEMHGYEIAESIHTNSQEALSVEEGALYPALHRLESRGLLSSRWDISANNRRAKYYRLTPAGRKQLREATESWQRTSIAVNRILEST